MSFVEREQAIKDVGLIKGVLEKTNIYFSNQAPYYVLWGLLVLAASSVQQLFYLKEPVYWAYPLLWILFAVTGGTGSYLIGKIDKTAANPAATYLGWNFGWLWVSGFLAIAIVVLLSISLSIYDVQYIMVFIILIIGLVLVSTGLFLHRPALYLGLLCLPVSIAMVYYPAWQPAIFGLIIGGGYLVIAVLSFRNNRCQKYGG